MTARTDVTTYALVHFARPWAANAQRSMHWREQAHRVAEWRRAFWALAKARHVPPMRRIAVTVQPEYRGQANRPDTAACYGPAKAAIDGLVDAKVVADDDGDHVVSITFLPPVMGAARDALRLTIEEAEPA